MYLERPRTKSLEGFLMYAHYGCVGAIPTYLMHTEVLSKQSTLNSSRVTNSCSIEDQQHTCTICCNADLRTQKYNAALWINIASNRH